MDVEFAYSRAMQIILAIMTFSFTFVFIYLIANLILQIFGERANSRQKAVFSFFIGGILNTIWSYSVYFLGGMQSFTPTVYALVVNPNPAFALLYYVIGVKVLKIPPVRSIKLMGHVYLYYVIIQIFNRILNTIYFVQAGERYNYLLDALCQLTLFSVILIIYFITKYFIRRYNYMINLNLYINFRKELLYYMLKATFIYVMIVFLPLFVENQIVANLVIMSVFVLIFVLTNLWEQYSSLKNELGYRDEYIRVLASDDDGTLEKSSLRSRISENPSLISILIGKCQFAEINNVKIDLRLHSSTSDFFIDNIDICKIVDCLLENAIEAAAASQRKTVSFMVGSAATGEKLIIITYSTAMPVETSRILFRSPEDADCQNNNELSVVRRIVSKHGNCTFKMTYRDYEMSTYLETKIQSGNLAEI